jgi:hypothetical protein
MQDESQPFVFFETPESLVLFETPAVTLSAPRFVRRLKMMSAGVVIAGLAAIAISSADSPGEPETTRWQRITEATEGCSTLEPGTAAEIQCRVEAGNTP